MPPSLSTPSSAVDSGMLFLACTNPAASWSDIHLQVCCATIDKHKWVERCFPSTSAWTVVNQYLPTLFTSLVITNNPTDRLFLLSLNYSRWNPVRATCSGPCWWLSCRLHCFRCASVEPMAHRWPRRRIPLVKGTECYITLPVPGTVAESWPKLWPCCAKGGTQWWAITDQVSTTVKPRPAPSYHKLNF